MPVLRFVFSLTLLLGAIVACNDIPRDNPLDPKNPGSMREQQVLIEAFINTNTGLADSVQYNQNMMYALSRLEIKYARRIMVVVHHRNLPEYLDPLAIFESDNAYTRYIEALDDAVKGVPDLFVNGLGARIQGATTAANAEYRIESALQAFLTVNSYFTVEPVVTAFGGTLKCSAHIARLGDTGAHDLLLKLFVLQDVDDQWDRQAVRAVRRSNFIPVIQPGERKNIEFDQVTGLDAKPTSVVVAVVSDDELTVYQGAVVRL